MLHLNMHHVRGVVHKLRFDDEFLVLLKQRLLLEVR